MLLKLLNNYKGESPKKKIFMTPNMTPNMVPNIKMLSAPGSKILTPVNNKSLGSSITSDKLIKFGKDSLKFIEQMNLMSIDDKSSLDKINRKSDSFSFEDSLFGIFI